MQCSKCHNEIDESRFPDLAFCPYCGAPPIKKKNAPQLTFCPYCGKELKEATPFCPQCGKQLPDEYSAEKDSDAGEAVTHQHHDILTEGKEFLGNTAGAIKRSFGRERKVRKLYEQWAEHSDLPEDEVTTLETQIHHTPKSRYYQEEEENYESLPRHRQQMPILYILLALAVLIIVAGLILLLTR